MVVSGSLKQQLVGSSRNGLQTADQMLDPKDGTVVLPGLIEKLRVSLKIN